MGDKKLAMLGNKEAAKRLAKDGVLLPCPKCQGKAMRESHSEDWLAAGFKTKGFTVFCEKCKISVQYAKSQYEADLDWNTREPAADELNG